MLLQQEKQRRDSPDRQRRRLDDHFADEAGFTTPRAREDRAAGERLNQTRRQLYARALLALHCSNSTMDDATLLESIEESLSNSNSIMGEAWSKAEQIASTMGSTTGTTPHYSYIINTSYSSIGLPIYKIGHSTNFRQRLHDLKKAPTSRLEPVQVIRVPALGTHDYNPAFERALHYSLDKYRIKDSSASTECFSGEASGESTDPVAHFMRVQQLIARVLDVLDEEADGQATSAEELADRLAAGIGLGANGLFCFPQRPGEEEDDNRIVAARPSILNDDLVALSRGYKAIGQGTEKWKRLLEWVHSRGHWLHLNREMERAQNKAQKKCHLNDVWSRLQVKLAKNAAFAKLLLEKEEEQADAEERQAALKLAAAASASFIDL